MTKITKQEFDAAVDHLRRQGRRELNEAARRIFVAVSLIMRNRRNMPDDMPWEGPTDAELAEFLASENRRQRKILKGIAEGITSEVISVDEYLAETGQRKH